MDIFGWINEKMKDGLEIAYLSGGTWGGQGAGVSPCYTPCPTFSDNFVSKLFPNNSVNFN